MLLKSLCRVFVCSTALALMSAAPTYCQAADTPPANPVTTDQVRELLDLTHAVDRMGESIDKLLEQQKTAMSFMPDAFWSDFKVEFKKLDWVAIAAPIYQKHLSQEDAVKIIAFYKTEAGQHALDSSFAVYNEMSQAGFEQGKIIGTRLGAKYQTQIQENIRKAQQASPQTSAPK